MSQFPIPRRNRHRVGKRSPRREWESAIELVVCQSCQAAINAHMEGIDHRVRGIVGDGLHCRVSSFVTDTLIISHRRLDSIRAVREITSVDNRDKHFSEWREGGACAK